MNGFDIWFILCCNKSLNKDEKISILASNMWIYKNIDTIIAAAFFCELLVYSIDYLIDGRVNLIG